MILLYMIIAPSKYTFQNISALQKCFLKKYVSKTFIIIYISYNNLGICAVIVYFCCMLKARKNTNNLGYVAYICLHGIFLKLKNS